MQDDKAQLKSTIMMSYADMARTLQRPVLTVLAFWARFLKGAAFGVLLCVPAISVLVLILWLESVYGK